MPRKIAGDTDNLVRICIRCKRFRWVGFQCSHFELPPSPVTGTTEYRRALECREDPQLCGMQGRNFAPIGNCPF